MPNRARLDDRDSLANRTSRVSKSALEKGKEKKKGEEDQSAPAELNLSAWPADATRCRNRRSCDSRAAAQMIFSTVAVRRETRRLYLFAADFEISPSCFYVARLVPQFLFLAKKKKMVSRVFFIASKEFNTGRQ